MKYLLVLLPWKIFNKVRSQCLGLEQTAFIFKNARPPGNSQVGFLVNWITDLIRRIPSHMETNSQPSDFYEPGFNTAFR